MVKSHYLLLVILCLVAVMYGTEFSFIKSNVENLYDFVSGNPITIGNESFKLNNIDLKNIDLKDIDIDDI